MDDTTRGWLLVRKVRSAFASLSPSLLSRSQYASSVTPNKGSEPQFGEAVYICEANGAREVKSDA